MAEDSPRTPTLAEVINASIENVLSNVHTCLPGRVISYDPTTGTADIQPLLKRKYAHESSSRSFPVIPRVPVVFQRTSQSWLLFPVSKGDLVELRFVERSIDRWFEKGGEVDPEDGRRFDISDAIATPGLYPKTSAIVKRGSAGSVELANKNAWIEITSDGKFQLKSGSTELMATLANTIAHLMSLQVITQSGPAGLSPATLASLQSDLLKIKSLGG